MTDTDGPVSPERQKILDYFTSIKGETFYYRQGCLLGEDELPILLQIVEDGIGVFSFVVYEPVTRYEVTQEDLDALERGDEADCPEELLTYGDGPGVYYSFEGVWQNGTFWDDPDEAYYDSLLDLTGGEPPFVHDFDEMDDRELAEIHSELTGPHPGGEWGSPPPPMNIAFGSG